MADWNAMRTEYITTNTSYRKLARKYGVDQTTVARRAKREGWVNSRQQNASKMQAKILAADTKRKVSRAERLQTIADRLLNTLERRLLECEALPIDSQTMKQFSGVLKDIKDIQMIQSERDAREQEARIAKLNREALATQTDKDRQIIVTIEGGEGVWKK